MFSANRVIFISSFLTWMSFISYSCLIMLAKIFSMLLSRSDKSGNLCLISDLWRKAFSLSTSNMMLAADFFCRYTLSSSWNFLLALVCWEFFFLSWMDVVFCKMYQLTWYVVFFFRLLMLRITFLKIKLDLHSWNKPPWVVVYSSYIC